MVKDISSLIERTKDILYVIADSYEEFPSELEKEIYDIIEEWDEVYMLEDRYGPQD